MRKIVLDEALAEVEHVCRGQDGLTLFVELYVGPHDVAVASEYCLGIRIPHHNLLVGIGHGVEFVDICLETAAAACLTEGFFAQTADFPHYVGGVVRVHNVDYVAAFVGVAEFLFRSELGFQELYRYRVDNLFHTTRDYIPFP